MAHTDLLILQSTPFCNLDCSYCYLPDRANQARMLPAVMRAAVERLAEADLIGSELTIVWHAGEPLTLPVAYYEEAMAAVSAVTSRHAFKVFHSFQTNGTTITERWLPLLSRPDVRLGLSIDGPRDLHDLKRKNRAGGGSHDRVMASVALLRKSNIDFHVICVVTASGGGRAQDVFRFFHDNGVRRLGFNFEEQEGVNRTTTWQRDDEPLGAARAFLGEFLDLNQKHGSPIQVREFANLSPWMLRGGSELDSNQENTPFRIVSVAVDGSVSTFSPELLGCKSAAYDHFLIGNVLHHSVQEMKQSRAMQKMQRDISKGVAKCRASCEYFGICGGGSPGNKFFELGTFDASETVHCRQAIQGVSQAVLAFLEASVELERRESSAEAHGNPGPTSS